MNSRLLCLLTILLTPSALAATSGGGAILTIDAVALDFKSSTHLEFKLTAHYVVFDTTQTKPRQDGGVPVTESQAEFRASGAPVPVWIVDVPSSGKVAPQQFKIQFKQPFDGVKSRVAAVTLKIEFTQMVYGEQGKMTPIARKLTLPIPIPAEGATALRRCLVAQLLPDGLNVRLEDRCPTQTQASP